MLDQKKQPLFVGQILDKIQIPTVHFYHISFKIVNRLDNHTKCHSFDWCDVYQMQFKFVW